MHARFFVTALVLAPASAFAQELTRYDAAGDPLVDFRQSAPAPGDVLGSFSHGFAGTDGLAPFPNGHLLVALADGQALVYEVDTDGATIGSYPVANDNDTWLAYDESRDLIITTNPVADRVRGYTPGTATPVFDIPATVAGPVGATWDPVRDEYAVCDWESDVIVVFDAATLSVVRTLTMPLTRMAGMGFDCVSGMYVVGDRDSATHAIVDPLSGQITSSYATATVGASSPRGHAVSTRGGMWAGSWNSPLVVEQETDHAPIPGACDDSPFALRCDPASPHSGGTSATLVASSVSGPGALHLEATAGPVGQFGYFLVSLGLQEPGQPVANGFLCLTFPLARFAPGTGGVGFNSLGRFDAAGVMQNIVGTSTVGSGYDVFPLLPAPLNTTIQPGTTYYFQCWFRDGLRSNFSNVLQFQ